MRYGVTAGSLNPKRHIANDRMTDLQFPFRVFFSVACRRLEQIVLCAAEQPADVLQLEGRVREQACVIQGCDMFDSRQHGASSFARAAFYHRLESQHVLYVCKVLHAVYELFLTTNHSP